MKKQPKQKQTSRKRRTVKTSGKDPEDFFDLTGERLGKGAYGIVIKAKDRSDGTWVAMKILDIEKVLDSHFSVVASCNN